MYPEYYPSQNPSHRQQRFTAPHDNGRLISFLGGFGGEIFAASYFDALPDEALDALHDGDAYDEAGDVYGDESFLKL